MKSGSVKRRILYFVPNQDAADEVSEQFIKASVDTIILKGKERLCHPTRVDIIKSAHEQKIPTSGLCKTPAETDRDVNIIKPEQQCPFYEQCQYIGLRKKIFTNTFLEKVVILPIQYLKTNKGIPEELNPSLIVVDESFHSHLMNTFTMKFGQLGRPWVNVASLGKKYSKHYPLLDLAAKSIIRAASKRQDIIADLITELGGGSPALAIEAVKNIVSLRVEERKIIAPMAPTISRSSVERLSKALSVSQGQELDFWRGIATHLEGLVENKPKGRVMAALEDQTTNSISGSDGWVLSISIRDPFPFSAPMMFLDASANADVYNAFIEETHEMSLLEYEEPPSPIHRTAIINKSFSTASLTADETSSAENVRRVVARKNALREALLEISKIEKDRKVLIIATKKVTKILNEDNLPAP